MARVLIVEKTADGGLDVALRAQAWGHQPRYYLQSYDPVKCPVGKGLVERVADWRNSIGWADLVLLCSNDLPMQEIERRCRDRGVPWIGGTAESARWENDRLYGMEMFERAGIAIPEVHEFTDYDRAIAFVEQRGEPMYCKPCWPDADKALSCKTGVDEEPAYMLRKFKRQHSRPKGTFILQEPVSGIEMGVGRWFGPAGWAPGIENNFEFKKFAAGDVGPNTGEMGSVLQYVSRSKLADRILHPFEDMLAEINYIGCVDVNAIIDDEGMPWPLEFTMRCGWPALNIELALIEDDPIEFLASVATGEVRRGAHRLDEVAVGVVYALPPFPFHIHDYEEVVGIPLYGVDSLDDIHPAQLMIDREQLKTAGDYVLIVTGTDESVTAARRRAYRNLEKITAPASPLYRVDIGSRLRGQLPKLQQHGYATGLTY